MYRVNFNGQQVSGTFKTYAAATRYFFDVADFNGGRTLGMWIQRRIDGEWFSAKCAVPVREIA